MADSQMAMLEEKWKMTFLLMDVNKDGVISIRDRDACKERMKKVYEESGQDAASALNTLDAMWDTAVFLNTTVDWSKEFPLADFIQLRAEAYTKDKESTIAAANKAVEHMLTVGDLNGDKIFTFEKFFKFNQMFNITDEEFVKANFGAICKQPKDVYQFSEVQNFYLEFIIGNDAEFHTRVKAVFSAAGLI